MGEFLENTRGSRFAESGEFTISREAALSKMAEYQLPFQGAWVLKVVQAAVASGALSVKVQLTKDRAFLIWRPDCHWSADQVESAFPNPSPTPDRALNHLLAALRAVGVGQSRKFQIKFPGRSCLVWDGQHFGRAHSRKDDPRLRLTVEHASWNAGFISRRTQRTQETLELTKALTDHCFTCPVPLSLDARRLDSLLASPGHSTGKGVSPLGLIFGEGDLPELRIPRRTFESVRSQLKRSHSPWGLNKFMAAELKGLEDQESASVAILWSVHHGTQDGVSLCVGTGDSRCYWVQDGVMVDSQSFGVENTSCSLGCFVNADELPTDLTSLRLAESEERKRRLAEAHRIAGKCLYQVAPPQTGRWKTGAVAKNVLGGFALTAFGVLAFKLAPFNCLVAIIYGGKTMLKPRKAPADLAEAITSGIPQLRENWGKEKTAALVLAAGGSTRCGGDKLLRPFHGRPLLSWTLSRLDSHPLIGQIVLVVGHRAEEVAALAPSGCEVVVNPNWAEGLSSSLKVGVQALPEGCAGALVVLGDTPFFHEETVTDLLPPHLADEIVVPVYEGEQGHPKYFPRWFLPELLHLEGDRGAKALLEGQELVLLETDDSGILLDFDEPEHFRVVPEGLVQ